MVQSSLGRWGYQPGSPLPLYRVVQSKRQDPTQRAKSISNLLVRNHSALFRCWHLVQSAAQTRQHGT
eukprot:2340625-Rhodomonas_salina.3